MRPESSHADSISATESVLGFDFGAWRVGIAVGERLIGTGKPLTTLHNANAEQIDWEAVLTIIKQWQPQTLIVGWPVDDQGDCYPIAAAIRRFAARLHEKPLCPSGWLMNA
ncbi:MAG TPA: Holliday junction resolvase RuvX [Halothiobacillaceae bacterium]|nr:Holliday junction resolvase RuvX [Halothiobacillaceae bacterium]